MILFDWWAFACDADRIVSQNLSTPQKCDDQLRRKDSSTNWWLRCDGGGGRGEDIQWWRPTRQTDLFPEAGILDDSVQCWSNLRIEYFKIRHLNSSYRARRFQIIHWFNHLHFFDPQHSFRRKLWISTYLSLESYLPTSKCCWVREFVKMEIQNLQSLLVCPTILLKSSLTRVELISGWRSLLACRILNRCLAFTHLMWWCVFWHIRNPRIESSSRIRWWTRRLWIYKNVSRYTMRVPNVWRLIVAARHS